jgi:hypothetical protein
VADIDERIEQSIRTFADELRELVREAAHEAIDEALAKTSSSSPSARRSGAKPSAAKKRAAPKKRRPRPKGARRTSEQMQRDLDALREHIRRHPGATAMEIGAALGMASREITRPIKKLIPPARSARAASRATPATSPPTQTSASRAATTRIRGRHERPSCGPKSAVITRAGHGNHVPGEHDTRIGVCRSGSCGLRRSHRPRAREVSDGISNDRHARMLDVEIRWPRTAADVFNGLGQILTQRIRPAADTRAGPSDEPAQRRKALYAAGRSVIFLPPHRHERSRDLAHE